jgi:hypothetical protein
MRAGPHLSETAGKLRSCGATILYLIALINLTSGVTQSLPSLAQARSARVALAHRNQCFENLDLQFEVFPAAAQAFRVIAKPHRPKAAVSFIAETPVDSRRQNRPPPSV